MSERRFIQIQTTFPDAASAREVAQFLVESRLVACAQVAPTIESSYVWQGEICCETEALLLCKTRANLFSTLRAVIAARHSYKCPQIVGMPLEFISPDYEEWLDAQIQPDAQVGGTL